MVLIIDNCEHLIEGAAQVVEAILQRAPNVRVLATSREPLRVAAEHLYRVPPLALPPSKARSAEEARRYGAIALFAERAEAAHAAFRLTDEIAPIVSEVCARLDGVPLAVELGSRRARASSPTGEISERLDQRFSVLTGGRRTSLPRQQTMRALIDWSYDLLSENEKKLFRDLGVFTGDFSFDAVASIRAQMAGDGAFALLASLVEKSLVHAETIEGKTRFRLLESMRAYAHESAQRTLRRVRRCFCTRSHAQAYLLKSPGGSKRSGMRRPT